MWFIIYFCVCPSFWQTRPIVINKRRKPSQHSVPSLSFGSYEFTQRTWEANLVSEFLVQLEQGPGMVIGTTNRIDAIDMASRRRFLLRVEFRFLDKGQVVGLYNHIFSEIMIEKLSAEQIARLSSITNATAAGLFSIYNGMMLAGEKAVCHDQIIEDVAMEFESLSKGRLESVGAIGFS